MLVSQPPRQAKPPAKCGKLADLVAHDPACFPHFRGRGGAILGHVEPPSATTAPSASASEALPPAAWRRRGASIVTGTVVIAAGWSLVGVPLHLILPRTVATVDEIFAAVSVPAGHTFFSAVYLGVLATALRQGKRIAILWVFWFFAVLGIAADLGNIGVDIDIGGRDKDVGQLSWFTSHELVNIAILLTGIALAVMVWQVRRCYRAKLTHGSRLLAIAVLVVGFITSISVSIALTEPFPRTLHGQREKIFWAVAAAFGRSATISSTGHGGHAWVAYIVGAISATTLIIALAAFLRSVRKDHVLSQENELRVRRLLLEWGDSDSLGYFATRRDKALIWSPNGEAVIAYRVIAGISLASGDPVGNPNAWSAVIRAWLDEASVYGWAPGVVSASEIGAKAYVDAGFRALSMGDEAIIDVADFTLDGRTMRPVRQAVTRATRAGYRTEVVRHRDLTAAHRAELATRAAQWRGAQTERGFSMALSRLGDAADGSCLAVLAFGPTGELAGVLSFVPWGSRGISLDVMRRDPASVNGLIEFMVASLVETASDHGVHRISLNFAMFREVFSDAERVGAGPVLRIANSALTFASRFWQLHSLYQSNEKYLPRWSPRLICYGRSTSLTQLLIAAGIAEGFIPAPRPPRRRDPARPSSSAAGGSLGAAQFAQEVRRQEATLLAARVPIPTYTEQELVRRHKLERLIEAGVDPYPVSVPRTDSLREVVAGHVDLPADAHTGQVVSVAGRIEEIRGHGGLGFAVIDEGGHQLQVMLDRSRLGRTALDQWRQFVDLGDHVSFTGEIVTTRRGRLSVSADSWTMAAKCLHPLPDTHSGFADPDLRVRRRYLDLLVNDGSRSLLDKRTAAVGSIRESLSARGFTEVETPMLQPTRGGANARPFVTHINAYDSRLTLRTAPELYLKRLCVAGAGKIFELNRSFRNEGADATHNPEFTSVEAYQPYADYTTMRELTVDLVTTAATVLHGRPLAHRRTAGDDVEPVDISPPWPVVTVYDAVSAALGEQVTPDTTVDRLRALCSARAVRIGERSGAGEIVAAAYDQLVEPSTDYPTFYVDFPVEASPLARNHRDDPRLAERWDLVAFGMEIGTAYSELTDPVEQRRRLTEQSMRAAAGDPEAMSLDEDFLTALEYAMPPTGGLGLGVDRVVMMLTGATIRQVITFPFVRPLRRR